MLYTILRIIFAIFFQVLFRAKTYGKEHLPSEGPVILAANHMSNWDPPLLATFLPRPVSYMAKIELFEHPIFGAAIRRCHAFPVRRGAADRGAIKAAINVLKQGRVLGLFPEGTRSKDGKLHKAEAGVGLLAAMSAGLHRRHGPHHAARRLPAKAPHHVRRTDAFHGRQARQGAAGGFLAGNHGTHCGHARRN